MRSYLPAYDLHTPMNLASALALLGQEPGLWQPLAGGTDLMVLFEAGKLAHRRFLNIGRLNELKGIEVTPECVTLGALTTYTEVRNHSLLHQEFPLLGQAAAETSGMATQNRGTLGGNIANASPAADSPPALLVYDAELELISARGARWVSYSGFHTGYKTMLLSRDELVCRIRLPRTKKSWRQSYRKVGTRKAQAIAKLSFAGALEMVHGQVRDVRIALASVAPTVVRCTQAEEVLKGRTLTPQSVRQATEALGREIAPIDDLRSTAEYRRRVAQNLLADFLLQQNQVGL